MMGFHAVAFDDIGIDGALSQEFNIFLFAGFFFENADKFSADDLAFLFRIGHAGQFIQKAIHSVDIDEVGIHLIAEYFHHLFGFAFAEQTVVYMDADQLTADGFNEQCGNDGRVHAAGKGEKDFFIADLFAERSDLFVDESFRQFLCVDARHIFRAFVVFHNNSSGK